MDFFFLRKVFTFYFESFRLLNFFFIIFRYLYKKFIQLTIYYNIPTVSCWERVAANEAQTLDTNRIEIDDNDDVFYRHNLYYYYDQHTNVVCDGPGLPIFFYLEVTWYLGGLTLFALYIFATYLR